MLAENLKALRKAKGLSQEELAARVQQTVSQMGKGRSVPDADLLIRLAEELDTTSAALLGPEVPPEAERGGTAAEAAGPASRQLFGIEKPPEPGGSLEGIVAGSADRCDGQFVDGFY